jgi:dipeptidyl aminopeptidase/acylaminoacyl peptidase
LPFCGSADDNVHLANAMKLSYAFRNARIPFALIVYPQKLHHIDWLAPLF